MGFFAIDDAEPVVRAWRAPGVEANVVRTFFHARLLPLVLLTRGCLVLHASAVSQSDRAIALTGVSGSGKSTLARTLATRGFDQIADDALVMDHVPLAAIVVLKQDVAHSGAPVMTPLSGPRACLEVMAHAHVFNPEEDVVGLVSGYSSLANHVPIYELRFRPDIRDVSTVAEAITKI